MQPTLRNLKIPFVLFVSALCSSVFAQTGPLPLIASPLATDTKHAGLADGYGKLPLSFEANQGQTDRRVKFVSRGSGYTLFLTGNEAVLALKKSSPAREQQLQIRQSLGEHEAFEPVEYLRMKLAGANKSARVSGEDELSGKSNYFLGNDSTEWRTNVSNYAKVKYTGVYPGVNLVYYGDQRQLEYDFVVAPGADTKQIRLRFQGAKELTIDEHGALVIQTQQGEVQFKRPVLYQEIEGRKHEVEGRYVSKGRNTVGFEVANYDRAKPLVIDPVLVYSTYLGGSDYDYGTGIAVDSSGNAYVVGYTISTDFPTGGVTPSSFGALGSGDAFVAKFNASGSSLVYSTYLGGNNYDIGTGIALDSSGNAYVTGHTQSFNFPTVNPFQSSCHTGFQGSDSCSNAFVAKINSTGSPLLYSTFLGGSSGEGGNAIAVDPAGNAYVTGLTASPDFPTVNALQSTIHSSASTGNSNAFVTEINASGSALVYSTYLGGSDAYASKGNFGDVGTGIAVDSSGNAYITGSTVSSDFPTANALQAIFGGAGGPSFSGDVFVAKISAGGSSFVYSTFLGGSSGENGGGIAVDSFGNAYVTGQTLSTNFPTVNALQPNCGGAVNACVNAFVAKINASGSALIYSTFLGGSNHDSGYGIAADTSGNAYVTGVTNSPDFPIANAIQPTLGGSDDIFVTKIDAAGSSLGYSTFLGGENDESSSAIAVDSIGNAYVTGRSESIAFPTVNALQPIYGGGTGDAIVAKILASLDLSPSSVAFANQPVAAASAPQTITLSNGTASTLIISNLAITGTNASDFAETDNCDGSVAAGSNCAISVTFTPTATGTRTAAVTVANNVTPGPLAVPLSGMGIMDTRIVSLSGNSLAFSNQMVGSTSTAQTITLTNTGNVPLTFSSLVVSGANASEFAENDNCASGVVAAASCTINVTFAPTATGTRTAMLTITDNATSPASPQIISLTGAGVPPAPIVSLSATSVSFAAQSLGVASAVQTVTLRNAGVSVLNLQTIVLSGVNSSDFAIASGTTCLNGAALVSNASCAIQLTFTPTALGNRTASVSITDNAADSPETIDLNGTTAVTALVTVAPSSITFPAQYVGTSGLPQSVTVTNNGNAALSITSITVSPGDFALLNACACGSTVAPGSSCAVGIFFDPTASSTRSGTLTINDNAPGSPQTVALTGIGQDFSMAPSSPQSATIMPGGTASYSLTVSPSGGFSQAIAFSCSGAPAQSSCAVSPNSVTLNGSAPASVMVTVTTAADVPPTMNPGARDNYRTLYVIAELLVLLLLTSVVSWNKSRQPRWAKGFVMTLLLCAVATITGCGGSPASGGTGGATGGGNLATPTGNYTLVVSGTFNSGTTTVTHATDATLVVK